MENLIEKRSKFGAYEGVLVYAVAMTASLLMQGFAGVVSAIVIMVKQTADITNDSFIMVLNLIFMILIQVGFCLSYYFLVIRKRKRTLYEITIHKTTNSRLALLLCPLLALFSLLAFYPLAIFFALFLEAIGYTSSASLGFSTPLEHILAVLVIVILAPIFEELIFRGALLSGLRRKLCIHKSVLLSALCFMLMHTNPDQTAYQFMLGVVMGYAAVFAKTVIAPIIIHAVSNLLAYLLEFTALGDAANKLIDALTKTTALGVLSALGFIIVFSGVIFGILLLIKKLCSDVKDVEEEFEEEQEALKDGLDVSTVEGEKPTYAKRVKYNSKQNYKTLMKIMAILCAVVWGLVLLMGMLPKDLLDNDDINPNETQTQVEFVD